MRRAVITGYGIISSLGNNRSEVARSLRNGQSGIRFVPEYKERGFRSQVAGLINLDCKPLIDRKLYRFMGDGAAYCYLSMKEAMQMAGFQEGGISDPRIGLVCGMGGASTQNILDTYDVFRERGPRKVGPYMVPRTMTSSHAANLANAYKILGVNYSVSSACATSSHAVGHAAELIQLGKQDVVFAGGGDESCWIMSLTFDAMGALASAFNDRPETASRPYDINRDGFVISAGAGMVVVEEYEHARRRGATIYGEVAGYGATSDGSDMVAPSGEGAVRCMRMATQDLDAPVDYVNTHGTSTGVGDITELNAVSEVMGTHRPLIASTKSLSGHALGAAGVHELIYSLIMMEDRFVAASANIEELDPAAASANLVRETLEGVEINTVLSNSFGFGGTNAALVIRRV